MRFSKSYEPGEMEVEIYSMWERSGVFEPGDTKEKYSIVLPPPNANGNLHIGHGLTVAVEDSLIRYHRLRGEASWFVPGADHAGFETWVVYEKLLEKEGKSRFDYSRDELYAQVWDFVEEQRGNMELQLRALGASCDWEAMTFTLDKKVVDRVYETFAKMWEEGLIYRGEKLVNYCTKHRTAFADIEVVHEEEGGWLWDIAYPIISEGGPSDLGGKGSKAEGSPSEIVVSTTRPETMLGDVAVAVAVGDLRYRGLVGKKVQLPLTGRTIPVVADEVVDEDFGTGAVKITPAHDFNDFEAGERHGLEGISVISDEGKMLAAAGADYEGLPLLEAREKVLADLEKLGLLRGKKKIRHSVGHCYKCGSVLEPLLKEQWFIDVGPLAKRAVAALEKGKIRFYPASKKKVLINYFKGLKDWNISRQIPWGIAIPMYRRAAEGTSSGLDGEGSKPEEAPPAASGPEWVFSTEVDKEEIEVDGVRYLRDEDTFDTWFSSSHWPVVCTEGREGFYPLSVMETGADILFAWVARMIMMGLYVTGEVPFREVYLHGLVLDEKGQKMSKSKGNVINPMEMVGKYGSDAFRLGIIASRSAGMNQAFSESKVVAGRNLCNKLWNVARLVQGIVEEVSEGGSSALGGEGSKAEDPPSDTSSLTYSTENMGEDWICREIERCRKDIEKMYREYRFAEAEEAIYELIWNKYADWFLECQKGLKNTSLLKRTLEDILVMLHPMAPFVTEAIWQTLSWTEGMCVAAKWPSELVWDAVRARNFEKLQLVVLEARRVFSELSELSNGKRYSLLFLEDKLVDDNQVLLQRLTGAEGVVPVKVGRGLRLAVAGREVYLDAPEGVVEKYRGRLEERILAVGREVDRLNLRMSNAAYVKKAPKKLVEETRRLIAEKGELIERLKGELGG